MDALQQKLVTLHEKVDAIYGLVEHTHQMTLAMLTTSGEEVESQITANAQAGQSLLKNFATEVSAVDIALSAATEASSMTHKDVIPDTQGWEKLPDYNTSEQSLSPELQIRRLTAQVTAAYSRIAALEEQLLARRQSHSDGGGSDDTLAESSQQSPARWYRHHS